MNYSTPEAQKRALALALMECGAVLTRDSDHKLVVKRGNERGFKLKLHDSNPDAPLSPIYLNLRTPDNPKAGPLTTDVVELAAACMHRLTSYHEVDYSAAAGIPRAGDPFAESFVRILPSVDLIRLNKDESGGGRKIVSGEKSGSRHVLLVDDLVTKAESKLEAIAALRAMGHTVTDAVVLVDREQGGRQELSQHRIGVHSVFTLSELLDICLEEERISRELHADIKAYVAANN